MGLSGFHNHISELLWSFFYTCLYIVLILFLWGNQADSCGTGGTVKTVWIVSNVTEEVGSDCDVPYKWKQKARAVVFMSDTVDF